MFKEFGLEKCWLKPWLVLLIPFRIFIPEKIDLENVNCILRTFPEPSFALLQPLQQDLLTTYAEHKIGKFNGSHRLLK